MGKVQSTLVINDHMSKVLGRISKALGLTVDGMEALQKASGQAVDISKFQKARKELGAANASLVEMERQYDKINNKQDRLNQKLKRGSGAFDGVLGKLKGLAGVYLGAKTVTGAIELSDKKTQTAARLSMMNDGSQTDEALDSAIFASAQRSRGDYLATADAVASLGLMASDAFSSNEETIAFMEQINKQFKIAGTSAQGIDAAMLQLTQAMGSGVLRGEEYNSILEQAPNIIQSIAEYMGVPKGQLKDMAGEGKITAATVKAAMFACADETNAKFESIPKTWSDIWTGMKNRAVKALEPVLQKINELANNSNVQSAVDGVLSGLSAVVTMLVWILERAGDVYVFFADNWGQIAPIITSIAVALGILCGVILAYKVAMAIATAAQWAYNTALYGCPLVWILAIIIAVIAAVYGVVAAINKVTGKTVSATGVILGALAAAGAFIWDLILALLELVFMVIERMVNPFITLANFIGNVFRDPIGSVIKLFGSMADQVLAVLQKIASAMDFVFGTNMADGIQGWRDSLSEKIEVATQEYGNGKYEEVMSALDLSAEGLGLKRIAYSDAWKAGYSAGEFADDKIGGLFSGGNNPYTDSSGTYDYDKLLKNTDAIADNTSKSSEELSYLRDIAERDAINRFTTAEIKIDMTGMTNRIDSNMDIDGVISYLTDGVAEALATASAEVY